jgi:hypothetical protein
MHLPTTIGHLAPKNANITTAAIQNATNAVKGAAVTCIGENLDSSSRNTDVRDTIFGILALVLALASLVVGCLQLCQLRCNYRSKQEDPAAV